MESAHEVLRSSYSDIHEAIAYPTKVALRLHQEGVVAEDVLDEVAVATKTLSEKITSIMRAVSAAIKSDPNTIWVLIAVLRKFPESAPVANNMSDALRSHGLCEASKIVY